MSLWRNQTTTQQGFPSLEPADWITRLTVQVWPSLFRHLQVCVQADTWKKKKKSLVGCSNLAQESNSGRTLMFPEALPVKDVAERSKSL